MNESIKMKHSNFQYTIEHKDPFYFLSIISPIKKKRKTANEIELAQTTFVYDA